MYNTDLSDYHATAYPVNKLHMYTRNKMEKATSNWGLQGNPQPYTSIHNKFIPPQNSKLWLKIKHAY